MNRVALAVALFALVLACAAHLPNQSDQLRLRSATGATEILLLARDDRAEVRMRHADGSEALVVVDPSGLRLHLSDGDQHQARLDTSGGSVLEVRSGPSSARLSAFSEALQLGLSTGTAAFQALVGTDYTHLLAYDEEQPVILLGAQQGEPYVHSPPSWRDALRGGPAQAEDISP